MKPTIPLRLSLLNLALAGVLGGLSGCSQLNPPQPANEATKLVLVHDDAQDIVNITANPSPSATQPRSANSHPAVSVTEPTDLAKATQLIVEQHDNLWDEIASQLTLGDDHLDAFDTYLNFYLRNPKHLARVSDRAKPYLHYIVQQVKERNMPLEIALLPVIESGFQAQARSHQSAVGLWQFIPQTAHLYGLQKNWWFDGRQDVIQSTNAALDYLQKLYELNDNDWLLALASYNGGIGNVWKAVKKFRQKTQQAGSEKADFWQIRHYLPKETQHYVPQLLAIAHIVKNRQALNIQLEPIDNRPFFDVVTLDKQIDLSMVASLSDTPQDLLAMLNPGYLQAVTPPNGPYHIVLPLQNQAQFAEQLQKDASLFDIRWTEHKIKAGDTLSEIAERYKTTSKAIQKLNNMTNHRLRVGKTLLIPVPQHYAQALASQPKKTSSYKGPKFYHEVKNGESLWTIARYYNIDTKTLCNWNNIGVRTPLTIGQKLEIRSNQYGYQTQYTLKPGDSLWTVAQKFNVSTQEVANWNGLKSNEVVQPGQRLTLWQPKKATKKATSAKTAKSDRFKQYVVKSGDSLWDIAKANKVTTQQLVLHNQLNENTYLKPGQVLKIPYDNET
ncbi:MAG: LysM peptidoglycan-binding domain-containing protein [Gammaproteobacteria bacterium]|nr:LysM peptidoglycan-binding domain-containing protein [Gammaproteobacteria bacterium]MBD3776233.1 LysM peptidoglycan-binding domain-containing protein [Thiotrichales bacterium]